eukprot:m51a1_g2599 hypothetical protein (452) ;mRNA; f:453125-455053
MAQITVVSTAALLAQIPGPARFPPPTDEPGTPVVSAPAVPSFVSPFFHERKNIQFYGRLLVALHDYARAADQAAKNLRCIVWREVSQFAGRPTPNEPGADAQSADAPTSDYGYLEPLIVRLVRNSTVNLVALEIVYEGFMQAQRRFPEVFGNLFAPLPDASPAPASPEPSPAGPVGGPGPRAQRSNMDCLWGHTIQSSLLHLNLLHSWMNTLDKLSPFHKKVIWDTSRLVPAFRNYDMGSFRKTINAWVADPLPNAPAITAMFGAIGFLAYHNVLKHEFYYPNVRVAVFNKEPQANVSRGPPTKRIKRDDGTEGSPAPGTLSASCGAPPPPINTDKSAPQTIAARQAQFEAQMAAVAAPGSAPPPVPSLPAGQTLEKLDSLVEDVLPQRAVAQEWTSVTAAATAAAVVAPAVVTSSSPVKEEQIVAAQGVVPEVATATTVPSSGGVTSMVE